MPATVTVYRGHYRTLFSLPGIISLFIMCVGIGIIRNNSLVGERARAESNPGHCAHHALMLMAAAAECVNHWARPRVQVISDGYCFQYYFQKYCKYWLLISIKYIRLL